jgi:hypothetical protein
MAVAMSPTASSDPITREPARAEGFDFAGASRPSHETRFEVVLFRRTPNGKVMPGAAVEVANGDIAWRFAQAAASDHENVGAIALVEAGRGDAADGVLATFGQVNLQALRH